MKDDPELILDMIHALNQWMYETWRFDYEGRIFSTPVINLSIVDRALEELEWCLARGAKTVLVRPAPVPGFRGTRSMGLPSSTRSGRPACRPASRSACTPPTAVTPSTSTTGSPRTSTCRSPTAFRMVAMGKRPIEDTMAAMVCHGALHRNPELRVLSVENGASWVPLPAAPVRGRLRQTAQRVRGRSGRGLQARVYVAPFWEDDFKQMADLIGVDRVIFGSDWPHPEGLANRSTWSTTWPRTASTRKASERSWAAISSTCSGCPTRSSTSPACRHWSSLDRIRPTWACVPGHRCARPLCSESEDGTMTAAASPKCSCSPRRRSRSSARRFR